MDVESLRYETNLTEVILGGMQNSYSHCKLRLQATELDMARTPLGVFIMELSLKKAPRAQIDASNHGWI